MRPNSPVIPPFSAPRFSWRGFRRAEVGVRPWHGRSRQWRNGFGWSLNQPGIRPRPCPPLTHASLNWSSFWPGRPHGISSRQRITMRAIIPPTEQEARA